MFAIQQTYVNSLTGENWTRTLPTRWKTQRGAEKVAQASYRWRTRPAGGVAIDDSNAIVIEVAA